MKRVTESLMTRQCKADVMLKKKQAEEHIAENLIIKVIPPSYGA